MRDKTRYKSIYFADFETLTFDSKDYKKLGHTDVYMWYIKSLDGKTDFLGKTMDDFWKCINNVKENKIIYFHNLSFDGDFIFKYLLRNYGKYYKTQLEENNNKDEDKTYFSCFNNGNKIYSLVYHKVYYYKGEDGKEKKGRYKIKFLCSYNLLSSSVNALGKGLGLNKLQEIEKLIEKGKIKNYHEFYNLGGFNMEKDIEKCFIKYIKNDVEIIRLSYIVFNENLQKLSNDLIYSKKYQKNIVSLKNNITIGGLVYSISKNYIYNVFGGTTLKKYRVKSVMYDLMRNWFYGGWTQFNPDYWNKYLKNLDGIVIDINSSYPYQMTKLLPVGDLQKSINKKWKHYLIYYKIKVRKAIIKQKYNNFVILKNWKKQESISRYVRELYDFDCYYGKEEWDFINEIYDIDIESYETYFCEAKHLLKGMINELYEYKVLYDKQKDSAKKLCYKIMLNALYGRQCKRKQYDVVMWIDEQDKEYFKEIQEQGNAITINDKDYIVKSIKNNRLPVLDWIGVVLQQLKKGGRYGNILIGAQITSYARLQLWKAIYKIGVEKFIYCDTDSIFLNTDEDISKYVKLDNYELGAWGVECKFKEGKILGAKRYVFVKENNKGIKFGMSGLNNIDYNNIDIDKIICSDTILTDAQKFLERDNWGIIIKHRDFKIKEGGL